MKISLIIPVYNTNDKLLSALFDCFFGAELKNIEIIVIDDGSTNKKTKYCIEKYKKELNFTLYRFDVNKGVSACRNRGFELSSGDYVCFVDSDDIIDVSTITKVIEANYCFDVLIFKTKCIPYNAQKIDFSKEKLELENGKVQLKKFYGSIINENFKEYANKGIRCKIFNKEFLSKNEIKFKEGLNHHEDSLFFGKCCINKPNVIFCKNVVDFHRIRKNSLSTKFNLNYSRDLNLYFDEASNLFSENPYLMQCLYNEVLKICLPVHTWISFKTFHWKNGIKYLSSNCFKIAANAFEDNIDKYVLNKLNNRSYLTLYFKLNIKHLINAMKRK